MDCEQICQKSDKGAQQSVVVYKDHYKKTHRLLNTFPLSAVVKSSLTACLIACIGLMVSARALQDAVANGETRTISIYHTHTKESANVTFRRNGTYDREALEKLNWMLRDWRSNDQVSMDPRLFDVVWEAHRESGSSQPLHVVSAYRSPNTNAMLRSRSRGVAKHSQHMQGKAMDFYLPDVDMSRVRAIGMRLQRGGVGYYPSAFNPFVHLDAGSVRSWPRMSRDQLARLFPDGRTVHLPADGKPMAGYQEARASILSRGGAVAGFGYSDADEGAIMSGGSGKGLWASLFGGDEDADTKPVASKTKRGRDTNAPSSSSRTQVAAYVPSGGDDAGTRGFYSGTTASSVSTAPVIAEKPVPQKATAPVVVASLPSALQNDAEKPSVGLKQGVSEKIVDTPKPRLMTLALLPTPRPSDLKNIDSVKVASLVTVQVPPLRPAHLNIATTNVALKGSVQETLQETLQGTVKETAQAAPSVVASITKVASLTKIAHPLPPKRPIVTASIAAPAMVKTVLPPLRDAAQLEALAMQTASIPSVSQSTTPPATQVARSQVVKPLFAANPIAPDVSASPAPVIKQAKAKKLDSQNAHSLSVVGALDKPVAATRFQPSLKSDDDRTFSGEMVRSLASSGFEKL